MIWTWLSTAGRLLWPAIGGIVPAGNPVITITLLAGLLAAIVIGTLAAAVYLHMRGQMKAERIACNLDWKTEITDANQIHSGKLAEARKAAEAVTGTPADRAERVRICQQSPTCRDRGR
jgi:hypothetical protein